MAASFGVSGWRETCCAGVPFATIVFDIDIPSCSGMFMRWRQECAVPGAIAVAAPAATRGLPGPLASCRRLSLWPEVRSEEHTSELQSRPHLVCRLLLEKKKRPVTRADDI